MRITRDLLLSLARDNAVKMATKDRSLVCVYLVGSMLREEPFLGGVTDVDLVCVHDTDIKQRREIVRINADVHLDITHLPQSVFDVPRALRADPWIGCPLDEGPLALRDAEHWFDYTRASTTAQFWKTEFVVSRINYFAGRARRTWQQLADESIPQGLKRTAAYLDALSDTANAVACFTGSPLSTRRLLLELPQRAYEADLTDMVGVIVSLFTNEAFTDENWSAWTQLWHDSLATLKTNKDAPLEVNATRCSYFEKSADVLYEEHPAAALWIMLRTWTTAAACLAKSEQPYKDWQSFVRALELDSKGLQSRVEGLDALLDTVETGIESWQQDHG